MRGGKAVLLVFILLAVGVGFLFLPIREWFMETEGFVRSLGNVGPAVVALGYVLTTVFLIPGSAITIALASGGQPRDRTPAS